MSKENEKRSLREDLAIFRRAFKILWQICPQYLLWNIIRSIVSAATPYFGIYMSALLVNEITGSCDKQKLLTYAAITVIGGFILNILSRVVRGRFNIWAKLSWIREELYLVDVQNKMKYSNIENPDVELLRQKIFADKNAYSAGLAKLQYTFPRLLDCITRIIASIALSASIFTTIADKNLSGFLAFVNSPWAIASLVVIILLNSFALIKENNSTTQKTAKEWESLSDMNSLHFAYDNAWGEDTLIFGMKKIILSVAEKMHIQPQYIKNVTKIDKKHNIFQLCLSTVVDLFLFAIVAAKAYIGVFGIGNFLLYKSTVSKFIDAVSSFSANIGEIRFNNKYILNLFEYLDLPNEMYHGTLAVEKRDDIDYEIEFRNVSFKYPGTENYALKNVNIKFRIGDKLAIVGENGSGKTTFIKLLCRLYDPTEGTILLNGIDISRYRYEEYLALFSVVFQDYMLFSFTIAANVSACFDYSEEKVKNCLIKAGFEEKLNSLPKGIETAVGRDYENDGVDISGGEAQKIAIARALYKDAPFVVLDEPTAALDPIAEAEVYKNFDNLTENKTSVFISHRLSSCRFCDDIAVFNKGEIIQRGSHDTLVADKDGKYYQLWNAQAQYYT